MKKIFRISLLLAFALTFVNVTAKEDVPSKEPIKGQTARKAMKFGSDCDPATQSADLDVNNVRTKILNGGDMWWDLSSARYEVPKISDLNSVRKHSMFAGAIWIGGEDLGGNLRLAAMTYRQRGSDFWPGPLDPITSNTNSSKCEQYDKIWKVDGAKIIAHSEEFEANGNVALPDVQIADWPGAGNHYDGIRAMAPFKDVDNDGRYSPEGGDYPVLQTKCRGEEIDNEADDQPDQMLWWIYNDKGNIHSESQGDPIGVEMQTTAFAFATNDEINDMTFYTTRITNRGFTELNNTYFGQWVDADLGNYADDYVGCDVGLSLGFCYNGDDNDEGVLGYGLNPPSVGVDFFEGPTVDSVVNGVLQKVELGMSRFVYYNNNTNQVNGNPGVATDFYNYMRGKWRTGADIEYGGDGVTGTDGTIAKYMFPFDTDPDHSENWNERQSGNQPADRRFIQSSGPFVLEPGAEQRLTVGVVWAKSSFGGAEGSLNLLKEASKKAQELFNSCFDLIDGPDAPNIEVQELDQQLVLSFGNTNSDRIEKYRDTVLNGKNEEEYYSFQGYRVYQLKDGTVSLSELNDVSRAREVFQCDLTDSFDVLTNQEFAADVSANIPVLKVRGENEGVIHSLDVTDDLFATGSNKTLVNFKTYYYIVLSYAAGSSENRPYLEGRKVQKFSASPRKTAPRFSGSNAQSFYGDGPELIRLSGLGNGGVSLELKPESEEEIVTNNFALNPKYENAHGPVQVKVIDPLKVPEGEFELTLLENGISQSDDGLVAENTKWVLVKLPNDTIFADTTIDYINEQVILESTTGDKIFDWGLAVTISQVDHPGVDPLTGNGLIGWEATFEDPSEEWLTAIRDNDASAALQFGVYDWIRSGTQGRLDNYDDASWHDFSKSGESLDPNSAYEKIWDGRAAPFRLTAYNPPSNPAPSRPATLVQGPGFEYRFFQTIGLEKLSSVDLVITKDKSKWSECVMLESGEDAGLNQDGAEKFDLRTGQLSWSGGQLQPGKTIFPGYAINLETGERLNIIVTEDSYLREANGRDMKWNPTDNTNFKGSSYPILGGRHYIYIMGSHQGVSSFYHPKMSTYDAGNEYYNELLGKTGAAKTTALTKIFQNCDWVVPTFLAAGSEMKEGADGIPLPPNEFRLKLRVDKPYQYFDRTGDVNDGNPKYKFNSSDIYNEISTENGKDAIDLINIVPNPYYAFSGYESSPIDNKVKLTNLPEKCDISIYTLDGSLVRRIKKDDESTEVNWNLQNGANVPIASGLYIIHVDAGELGEKVMKWMGIMRELDLDSF